MIRTRGCFWGVLHLMETPIYGRVIGIVREAGTEKDTLDLEW